jgi:hypothetical protein
MFSKPAGKICGKTQVAEKTLFSFLEAVRNKGRFSTGEETAQCLQIRAVSGLVMVRLQQITKKARDRINSGQRRPARVEDHKRWSFFVREATTF